MADDETAQRLLSIPGVGPVTASLLATKLGDGKNYASSRDFVASTGLVPRQYSTGWNISRGDWPSGFRGN